MYNDHISEIKLMHCKHRVSQQHNNLNSENFDEQFKKQVSSTILLISTLKYHLLY